jgi:hypothetical protein
METKNCHKSNGYRIGLGRSTLKVSKIQRLFSIGSVGIWIALSAASGWAQGPQDMPAATQRKPTAQEQKPAPETDTAALDKARKAAQNPIASMISIPLQENWNFGIGDADRIQNVFNIQPVIPFKLGPHLNLITRWVTPIIYQPYAIPQASGPPIQTGAYGLGDMQPQFYFSPNTGGKVTWGAGPIFLVPTGTPSRFVSQGKFGIGPTFVALAQPKFGTIGVLVNNIWSVAGHADRADVNQMLLEPFINYNLKKAWYLSFSPNILADWKKTNEGRWVVPLGGGPGRIWKFGHQAVNVQSFFYGNVVHPPKASPWTFRMSFTLLFPKPR